MCNIAEYDKLLEEAKREDEAFRKAQPESPLELFCKKWNVYFENRWFKAKVVAANVLQTPACFPCVWRIVIQLESADIQLEFNVNYPELRSVETWVESGEPKYVIWEGHCELSYWFDIMSTPYFDRANENYDPVHIEEWKGNELDVMLKVGWYNNELMVVNWRKVS